LSIESGFDSGASGAGDAHALLRKLFASVVERTFMQTLGVYEPGVSDYITDLVTEFAHVKRIYKVTDLNGKPLEAVADMLLQGDVTLQANSFNREREVHKHIGDYTLFWTGVYPEALPALQSCWRKDRLIDYVKQGKDSYAIAASFDYGAYRDEAPVLKKISEEFELCMFGLNTVRKELDHLGQAA
jgi:hypothetical protein